MILSGISSRAVWEASPLSGRGASNLIVSGPGSYFASVLAVTGNGLNYLIVTGSGPSATLLQPAVSRR